MTDLFDPPAYHTVDPPTSRIAINAHEKRGKRESNKQIVMRLVRAHPGLTAVELWREANPDETEQLVEMQEVRRRLGDLHKTGKVRQGPIRACRIRGSKQVTWGVQS